MKVLLFTHKDDIDGLGCAVLASLSFPDLKYELCTPHNINQKIKEYIDNNVIYNYDKVFITDLSINEDTLSLIDSNNSLRDRVMHFDHHLSQKKNSGKYTWAIIKIDDEKGMCSGTSLFYQYLIDNKYLNNKPIVDRFQEAVRRYDTWEWVTKYDDEQAHELMILMYLIGPNKYITVMTNKMINNDILLFDDIEQELINVEKEKIKDYIDNLLKNMIIKEVNGNRVGILFTELYRDELVEEIKKRNISVDYITIINCYQKKISYRSINPSIDVSMVAKRGGGHKDAAAEPISNEQLLEIINSLIK